MYFHFWGKVSTTTYFFLPWMATKYGSLRTIFKGFFFLFHLSQNLNSSETYLTNWYTCPRCFGNSPDHYAQLLVLSIFSFGQQLLIVRVAFQDVFTLCCVRQWSSEVITRLMKICRQTILRALYSPVARDRRFRQSFVFVFPLQQPSNLSPSCELIKHISSFR